MNVVITGASSGIGRALAQTFARHEHPVLATARREGHLLELSREMAAEHAAPVTAFALDITAPGAPQRLLDEAVRVFGRVHVLVNDAGMSPYQEFGALSYIHMLQTIDLNVRALTELCYLFIPHMLAHGEPSRLVNVSSVGGYAPLPKFTVYSGSKHYVRVFTNLLTREYAHTNLRVSGLYPGGTLTEFPELAGQRVKPIARRNMLTPEQLAEKAYPAILRGRRVILLGVLNQLAVFMGKLLPFPWAYRVMKFVYDTSIEPVPPAYPLQVSGDKTTDHHRPGPEDRQVKP